MRRNKMGDFAPENVTELLKSLERIASALESSPVPDIDMKLNELIKVQKEGFEKIEQIIVRYAEFVHGKTL